MPTAWPSTTNVLLSGCHVTPSIFTSSSGTIGARWACTSRVIRCDFPLIGPSSPCNPRVDFLDRTVTHRQDRSDMVVRPDQHDRIGRAPCPLAEFVADIEQRSFAQTGVDRGIAPRHDKMLQAWPVGRKRWSATRVGKVQRDKRVVGQI